MTQSRPWPWWGRLITVAVLLVALLWGLAGARLLPGWTDVFGESTKDRSGPAVLQSLQDMSRYQAATGNFQIVIDMEKDTKYLPDAIKGSRTLYVGAGTVDAYVDLGGLEDGDVAVDEKRTSATVRLPHAALARPSLDPDRSYSVSKQRGLLDRLGDVFRDNPNSEQAVQKLAVKHLGEAARDSHLTARAEKNTTDMLEGLLRSLGFRQVSVRYGNEP
ncbi:hypothetical protein GCM10018793_63670 [Streptomyces sulfonofaciens]|uniref:DUF4230 domain-containing protein n=1 Tax=Streptomyces sulfonofaciens TaxID=68272 RepID=A0A919GMG1_9ACTN|nr:DUF4230 domain-containing protein [Streptomyces sulfonofaciens]GHH87530.1 hypothetical protein GCM10018793_63670 [Streptomyces sulfonofaciens]